VSDETMGVWIPLDSRRDYGCLDSWVSGFLGVWIPGVWIPGCLDSGCLDSWVSGFLDSGCLDSSDETMGVWIPQDSLVLMINLFHAE
jgi:hypothetical protein